MATLQQQRQSNNRKNNNSNNNNKKNTSASGGAGGRNKAKKQSSAALSSKVSSLLVLHGSRQTGQLLVGRMDKLRKKILQRFSMSIVAPDGLYPHPDDVEMRQWWDRHDNNYDGLEATLEQIQQVWNNTTSNNNKDNKDPHSCCGILGFSQGARLAHLLVMCHESTQHPLHLEGLKFVIMAAGYEAPIPTNLEQKFATVTATRNNAAAAVRLQTPSLHVFGETDRLILPQQSRDVMNHYHQPLSHVHEGGHHVPMRAASVEAYLSFMESILTDSLQQSTLSSLSSQQPPSSSKTSHQSNHTTTETKAPLPTSPPSTTVTTTPTTKKQENAGVVVEVVQPDEECAMAQQDEVEALQAIFPEEFTLLSQHDEASGTFQHPIQYRIALHPTGDDDDIVGVWPPHSLELQVTYPPTYPTDCLAKMNFHHKNNVMEFSSAQQQACRDAMKEAAEAELGMASVLSCVYAAREFFESGRMAEIVSTAGTVDNNDNDDKEPEQAAQNTSEEFTEGPSPIRSVSTERIQECNLQGLEIARQLLYDNMTSSSSSTTTTVAASLERSNNAGGTWKYTIGLVGKPSAGKSTFFNAATAFARQRDDKDNALGGATMAPHPFTTIDPNVGYCLVPAPIGSCPEESNKLATAGCTHGRDHKGRRLIPVMLKDVAGLVPGAYQGRGRGNKFLNDLTDADVLVHVVDASGTADTEGNAVVVDGGGDSSEKEEVVGGSHPLNDLAWIRNELIEWVYTNLMYKWDNVKRRGRERLSGMFSGYGQTQAVLWGILFAVEKYMDKTDQRDHALDHLEDWDQGDVHRLVSAFLGVRFPMALALNKKDLPSAKKCIQDVQEALPIHGAHVGIPLSAKSEMSFVRQHLLQEGGVRLDDGTLPEGVWQCLQSAITLREPVLVFPVADMATYAPLPGLLRHAMEDASLPSTSMISCLQSAGGAAPTLWNGNSYESKKASETAALRDVIVMKPGSTVEDVFLSLKRMGALGGEFVRAEGAGEIGEKPKLVPKQEIVHKGNRILKIMTNKRREWQTKN